ncbi:secreted protein-putative xanthan lyase [Rhodopirellula maiorica SM1]|uniref:Secreted protein-putative xanthan lyase n=1 Tax=Rhodopirellula maiorica SM1 TaxID=1265738 RepID=M5RG17_9BACT|nr:secreted protein-putative xanthan lyase [Rhodopirellula maiorica SM1]
MTTDPAVPESTRKHYARLGLCKDEFAKYGHFSPQLYVREGRRMKGMYVVSQKDILVDQEKEDPIVVSSFPIDSHDCQRIALRDGGVINEGTIFPVRMKGKRHGYPYHIPYRAILPMPSECSNLLVPVALSCTHVAISSIRVEPTWMILGQSAGIAAAMAADKDAAVQELAYPELRERLVGQKQVLEIPEGIFSQDSIDVSKFAGIVLDDEMAKLSGIWKHSTNFSPHLGRGYVHDDKIADGGSQATFRFTASESGKYEVRMAYSAHPTRATNVPVSVTSGSSETKFTVDQTQTLPTGKLFRRVGVADLTDSAETVITVTNSGTDGFVILDALQLVPLASEK